MKYFGIGFNKTGTTTLKECFRILGLLPHADYITSKHLIGDFVNNDFSKIHPFINNYTSFQDAPWSYLSIDDIKTIDILFTNSKFILTIRDSESWFMSLLKWHTNSVRFGIDLKDKVYTPYSKVLGMSKKLHMTRKNFLEQKNVIIKNYEKRNEEIIKYSKNKENFLVIDIFNNNNNWDILCNFLDQPVPNVKFPHKNKTK
jgi:hypothetical protein